MDRRVVVTMLNSLTVRTVSWLRSLRWTSFCAVHERLCAWCLCVCYLNVFMELRETRIKVLSPGDVKNLLKDLMKVFSETHSEPFFSVSTLIFKVVLLK